MKIFDEMISVADLSHFKWDRGITYLLGVNISHRKYGLIGVEPIYSPLIQIQTNGSVTTIQVKKVLLILTSFRPFIRWMRLDGNEED